LRRAIVGVHLVNHPERGLEARLEASGWTIRGRRPRCGKQGSAVRRLSVIFFPIPPVATRNQPAADAPSRFRWPTPGLRSNT
jgi:hypothetical protein